MEEKRSPIVAGVGGAALAAALVSMGGSSPAPSVEQQTHKAAVVQSAGDHADITSNQEGPWYAFCQEYATTEFDHGEDPAQQRGIKGHRVPEEAEEGTVEITKNIRNKKGQPEVEKFNVRKHSVGELSSCVPTGETLRVAIVTVPDPNATQMRLDFDRDVVAIQRAAAAEHYLYTRFWFPWRGSDWTEDKSSDPEAEIRRRQEPGILCFRKGGKRQDGRDTTDRLFVLLVGETPTSGVNRIQFAHALYYAQQLTGPTIVDSNGKTIENPSKQDELDVAGPLFSASFNPIQDVLRKLEEDRKKDEKQNLGGKRSPTLRPREASFVSPNASGQEFLEEFQRFCASNGLCTFQALALPSNEVRDRTLRFLDDLGYRAQFVAQLSEDESAFGESQIIPATDHKELPALDFGLKLHFPRDLSSVRNLSDEQSAKVAEAGSKYFSLPGGSLPTRLAALEPIDRDSPAPFGSEQEMAEVARALADSVAQMRLHHIRAVVITASNPLDRIYLLEYLHNQLPDVRPVTVDADTLELDRPHFVDLTGTLTVTAMPPLAGMSNTEEKTAKKQVDHTVSFASSSQEAEFLALKTLLHGGAGNTSKEDTAPCFYFSIVGANGFRLMPDNTTAESAPRFPCAVLKSVPGKDALQTESPAEFLTIGEHASAPDVFLTFAGVILFWNLVHFWSVRDAGRRVEAVFSYAARLVPAEEPARLYLLFVINNQLLIVDVMLSWLAWQFLNSVPHAGLHGVAVPILLGTVGLAALVAIGLSASLFLRFLRSLRAPCVDKKMIGMRRFQMSIATLYLVASILMVFSLPFHGSAEGIFLERITQLGDGLSPLLPITSILLGYFLWGRLQLRRLEWAASRKPHLLFSRESNRLLHAMVDSVQGSLDEMIPTDPRVQIACFGLAVLAAITLRHSLNGLEGGGFFWWFTICGVLMLLLTVAMTYAHAWSIWNHLRKLLNWLETTSMSETFKRLGHDGVLQVKIWDMAKTEKTFKFLRGTVDSVARLNGPESPEAVEAEMQFSLILRADGRRRQLWPGQVDRFSKALNVPMNLAVKSLSSDESPESKREELQVYLALRLVAMVRYGMLHIGAMVGFVAYGFVLAVGSIMFYPFEGRKTIGELLVITFVALLIWIGAMMVQFQRNEMLSHLEGSKPGEANYGQVVLHLLTVGGLPLIAVLTSQFPGIANFAYTFFRPLLSALH